MLILPDFTKPFELHTDASGVALGSALMQRDDNNEPRPVAFGGRALLLNEKNYTVTELETLEVIDAIKYFSPYLLDKTFTLYTDHANIKYLMNNKNL